MTSDVRIDRLSILKSRVDYVSFQGRDYEYLRRRHTDTKKLVTPSDHMNQCFGNNLSQVSSPTKTIFFDSPSKGLANCLTQLSTFSSTELESSAILRIASRKVGFEPVVMAFSRGRVTVGAVEIAV